MQNNSFNQFANTPRSIPSGAKISMLFFSPSVVMGLVLLLIGSGTFFIVSQSMNFKSFFIPEATLTQTEGVVTSVNISSTGTKSNARSWKIEFRFIDINGNKLQGSCISFSDIFKTEDQVKILYSKSFPSVAKIEGTEFNKFGLWLIGILLLFPGAGVMLLVKHFKECKKNFNILANGILTKGKVISKTPTGTKINKKPVYEVIFEFTDNNKNTIRSSVNSYKPEKLVDESEEPIVYLPSSPDKAILLDALPGAVRRFFDNN